MDWTGGMSQEFEYQLVDTGTWRDAGRLDLVESCTIQRDSGAETLGSASIDVTGDVGERYVRAYLVATQGEERTRVPLGTFLAQTPSTTFDGRRAESTLDAYTPLIELKECAPPLGYTIAAGENVMGRVARIASEHMRAPVVPAVSQAEMPHDFTADPDDTWATYLADACDLAGFRFGLDELGRLIFEPSSIAASAPVWTFTEGDGSILRPELTTERDLYGVPNAFEASWSKDGEVIFSRAVNDDPNSPASTVSRGREITMRETSPDVTGTVTQEALDRYAERRLSELSTVECRVTYSHGYCPVRLGDCVRLDYPSAGLSGVTARVVSQSIECGTGCSVEETATFAVKYWK